jgi:hypothetical protein
MNKNKIKQKLVQAELIDCEKDDYPDVRRFIQECAGEFIDVNDHIRAEIALAEVRRLDARFNFTLF